MYMYISVSVGARSMLLIHFACLGYPGLFTNDNEFFMKTKIAFFTNVAIRFTLL